MDQPPRTICRGDQCVRKPVPRAQGTPDTDVDRTEEALLAHHDPPQAAPTWVVPPISWDHQHQRL